MQKLRNKTLRVNVQDSGAKALDLIFAGPAFFGKSVIYMKVLMEIKDEKADFVMELPGSFSFVKTQQVEPQPSQQVGNESRARKRTR